MKPNSRKFDVKLHESHGNATPGKRTREYQIWVGMIARCYNEKQDSYPRYGGRGITVCNDWLNSFSNFLKDMGKSPSSEHTINRINNDGNYELTNCEWSTKREQQRNRNDNLYITANGQTKLAVEWAEELNIPIGVIRSRVLSGFSEDEVVNVPYEFTGYKSHNPIINPETAILIVQEYSTGKYTLAKIAEKYKVSWQAVQAITSGRNFSKITGIIYRLDSDKQSYVKLERTEELLNKVKSMLEKGISRRKIALALGVSRTVVKNLCDIIK